MAKKMEKQKSGNIICAGDIHYLYRDMSTSNSEWSENPSNRSWHIFEAALGSQIKLKKAYIYQAKIICTTGENVLTI